MRILSIDWDYFFPDISEYDFITNESVPLFYETIWTLRTACKSIFNKKDIIDDYIPNIPSDFWSIMINRPPLFVSEKHSDILSILSNSIVYHLDAHHDCGYQEDKNCNSGNWGMVGLRCKLIKELHLYYPAWRIPRQENDPMFAPTSIHFDLPAAQRYDRVFVCRSGCWTPPWFDLQFQAFITASKCKINIIDDYALVLRKPSMAEAIKCRDDYLALVEQLQVNYRGHKAGGS
jgi:hypothetical protein